MRTNNADIIDDFSEVIDDIVPDIKSKSEVLEDKKKRIKKEFNKLKAMFKGADKELMKLVVPTIHRLSFIIIQIEDLEEDILINGDITFFENGKQKMWIESQSSKLLVKLQKNYIALQKKVDEYFKEFNQKNPPKTKENTPFQNPRQRLLQKVK